MEKRSARLSDAPEQALYELYDRYAALVYACVKSVLVPYPKEETEECVLDVFSYVYAHRDRIDDGDAIKAYLCRAAKSMAIDRRRKLAKNRVLPLDAAERIAARESTEDSALQREEREALIGAIRALGEPDATLVIWRYYFSMSSREIAQGLHMKENTVDQRLRRARQKLQNKLKGAQQYGEV